MLLCNDTSVTPGTCCTHWQYVKQGSFCRTYPSCHHSWHHGLKPRKNPHLLIPISQNLQRKVSGQGKATLLLCQPLSKLLGQFHSSITLSCLHTSVCPVVARCKAQGQESHPFQQPPTIHHVKLHPQHAQYTK